MENIKTSIVDIYINLFLIAISRKIDFCRLVKETDDDTKRYIEEHKEGFLPEGYIGLFYVEQLARKMGSSLGDVYNLSKERRDEIVRRLVESFDSIEHAYSEFFNDETEGLIEFEGDVRVLDVSDEKEIGLYYADLWRDIDPDRTIFSHYRMTFCKSDVDTVSYTISISGRFGFQSDYMYDSFEVWSGTDGFFAEFIEKVIEYYRDTTNTHTEEDKGKDNAESEIEIFTSDNIVTKIAAETPVKESAPIEDGPKVIDELVEYVWEDTRTVDLLDQFEGYGDRNPVRYRRIVIKNIFNRKYTDEMIYGFNLVIERGWGSDYVGDVTFTQFKRGEASALARYIDSEVTDEIVEKYINKDRFYRFSKPYLLRAQNSSNRTGYGSEWIGGTYLEGTLYGETTKYFIVGVYITYLYEYMPSSREVFLEDA